MQNRVLMALVLVTSVACGGSNGSGPTVLPTPTPTPTPAPTPTPGPSMTDPHSPIYCVPPPPPLYTFRVKIHANMGYRKVLDSRVLVGRDANYCGSMGYGGDICVVRDEMDPQAVTCGNAAAGKAKDTGRYGPTWYVASRPPGETGSFGELCRPVSDDSNAAGCRNHPDNQFMLFAFGPGIYTACGETGGCASLVITE
jgi:hypothetical protein